MNQIELLAPTYKQMLIALSAWLGKAEGADKVLSAKFAPGMFPLSTQVRFSCLQAYECIARLRREDFLPIWYTLLEEGRNGGQTSDSIIDAQSRISDTVTFLETLDRTEHDYGIQKDIELKLPDDRVFDMTNEEYVRDWAIPQFYFHVMTAYSILRHEGVALGKADYVQHAFAYLFQDN